MFTATLFLLLVQDATAPPADRIARRQAIDYLAAKEWPVLIQTVEAWSGLPKADRARLVEHLTPAVKDRRRVPLEEVQDLIIFYRLSTGDLTYQGHGGIVGQDLFITGGRAAWALEKLLDVELPELNEGLTAKK